MFNAIIRFIKPSIVGKPSCNPNFTLKFPVDLKKCRHKSNYEETMSLWEH